MLLSEEIKQILNMKNYVIDEDENKFLNILWPRIEQLEKDNAEMKNTIKKIDNCKFELDKIIIHIERFKKGKKWEEIINMGV